MNRYIQLKGFILYIYNVASKDFFRFGAKKPKPGIIGSCGVTIGMRGVYILCVTCVSRVCVTCGLLIQMDIHLVAEDHRSYIGHGPWAMGLGPWAMAQGPWLTPFRQSIYF